MIRNRKPLGAFVVSSDASLLASPSVAFAKPLAMWLVAWTNAGTSGRQAHIEGRWVGAKAELPYGEFRISSRKAYKETDNEEFTACASVRPPRCLVAWWQAGFGGSAAIRGSVVQGPEQPVPPPPPPAPVAPALEFRVDWNPGHSGRNVDLHVIEPNGEHIYFNNKVSATGGRLGPECRCSPACGEETISWSGNAVPDPGVYQYLIQLSNLCGGNTNGVRYRLQVWADGRLVQTTSWVDLFCDPLRVPECYSGTLQYRHP